MAILNNVNDTTLFPANGGLSYPPPPRDAAGWMRSVSLDSEPYPVRLENFQCLGITDA